MNHSRESSRKFVICKKLQGKEAKRLFYIQRVSSPWHCPIDSGILLITLDAIFSFFNCFNAPIFYDR